MEDGSHETWEGIELMCPSDKMREEREKEREREKRLLSSTGKEFANRSWLFFKKNISGRSLSTSLDPAHCLGVSG